MPISLDKIKGVNMKKLFIATTLVVILLCGSPPISAQQYTGGYGGIPSPGPIGGTTPGVGTFSYLKAKGPTTITTFAGTASRLGYNLTFTSAADAILAGYNATNPVLGTTVVLSTNTMVIQSWTSSVIAVVDQTGSITGATPTSVQAPIAFGVNSSGTLKWVVLPTGALVATSFNSITGLSTVAPLIDGTATVGTSTLATREGHIHPTDTSRAPTLTIDTVSAPAFCIDAGSTDAYACTLSPAITAYVTGTKYRFKANTANTSGATIAFNGITSAKTITKTVGGITTALDTGDIVAGQWVDLVYDETEMQMVSQLSNRTNAALQSEDIPANASATSSTAGNLSGPAETSNTRKFLRELSVIGTFQPPVWDTLQSGDIPSNAADTSGKATTAGTADTANALGVQFIDWAPSSGATSIANKQIAFYNLGTVSGTDTYAATATPTFRAYTTGQLFYGLVTNANTSTTPTINVTSIGAKTIVKNGTAALVAGDIPAGHLAQFEYDGTYMKLLNPVYTQTSVSGNAATVTNLTVSSATTVGHAWTTPAFNAGDFVGVGGGSWTVEAADIATFAYLIIGKQMTVMFNIGTSTVAGVVAYLRIFIPATATKRADGVCTALDNGVYGAAPIVVQAGTAYITIYNKDFSFSTSWAASTNNSGVQGQITFEIN